MHPSISPVPLGRAFQQLTYSNDNPAYANGPPVTGNRILSSDPFGPVCLRSHWDPTQQWQKYTAGVQPLGLPMDPRPATRICMNYIANPDETRRPLSGRGGTGLMYGVAKLPNDIYAGAIDVESRLKLDGYSDLHGGTDALYAADRAKKPWNNVKVCIPKGIDRVYVPKDNSDLFVNRHGPPGAGTGTGGISELTRPMATIVQSNAAAACRDRIDSHNDVVSGRLFNNMTKVDRRCNVEYTLPQPPGTAHCDKSQFKGCKYYEPTASLYK